MKQENYNSNLLSENRSTAEILQVYLLLDKYEADFKFHQPKTKVTVRKTWQK